MIGTKKAHSTVSEFPKVKYLNYDKNIANSEAESVRYTIELSEDNL